MYTNCYIVSDGYVNKILKEYNKNYNSDFTFVWSTDYVQLVDFQNNVRKNEDDTLNFFFINFCNTPSMLKLVSDKKCSKLSECFSLYHDSSRKVYILVW